GEWIFLQILCTSTNGTVRDLSAILRACRASGLDPSPSTEANQARCLIGSYRRNQLDAVFTADVRRLLFGAAFCLRRIATGAELSDRSVGELKWQSSDERSKCWTSSQWTRYARPLPNAS